MKHTLKDIIDDYIKNMEKINDKRLEFAEKELRYVNEEVKLFNLFRSNLRILENAVSKNK